MSKIPISRNHHLVGLMNQNMFQIQNFRIGQFYRCQESRALFSVASASYNLNVLIISRWFKLIFNRGKMNVG